MARAFRTPARVTRIRAVFREPARRVAGTGGAMTDAEREPDAPQPEPTGPDVDPDAHVDPDEPQGVPDEALETESQGEGGPAGA